MIITVFGGPLYIDSNIFDLRIREGYSSIYIQDGEVEFEICFLREETNVEGVDLCFSITGQKSLLKLEDSRHMFLESFREIHIVKLEKKLNIVIMDDNEEMDIIEIDKSNNVSYFTYNGNYAESEKQHIIQQLRKIDYHKIATSSDPCEICYKYRKNVYLNCGHCKYCSGCLIKWLNKGKDSCPTCKTEITSASKIYF